MLTTQVLPATEAQLLDQQRLQLQLNHKGLVLSVNENASKAVFGFNPSELVGRPLAAFVNVFSQWKQKYGEDESLLVMLGVRAEQNCDVIYRVGVCNPYSEDELAKGEGVSVSGAAASTFGEQAKDKSALLGALRSHHKVKAAIMTLGMVHSSEDGDTNISADADVSKVPVLEVNLWRSDGLTALVETDSKLGIVRADPAAGLMFGVTPMALLRKSFRR